MDTEMDDEPMLKPQRRSHKKSKTGCAQCKLRRIKCDEHHPKCYNCKRRDSECDYPAAAATVSAASNKSATRNNGRVQQQQQRQNSIGSETTTATAIATSPVPLEQGRLSGPASSTTPSNNTANDPSPRPAISGSSGSPLTSTLPPFLRTLGTTQSSDFISSTEACNDSASDLELMHHYALVTAPDLGDNGAAPSMTDIWQRQVTRLAFRYPFLLKGVLTLSALHLAHRLPVRRVEFLLKASGHHQAALAGFQATLPHLDAENCHALWSYTCLLIPIAFAMTSSATLDKDGGNNGEGGDDDDDDDADLDTLHWIRLIRGGLRIAENHEAMVRRSFLWPIVQDLRRSGLDDGVGAGGGGGEGSQNKGSGGSDSGSTSSSNVNNAANEAISALHDIPHLDSIAGLFEMCRAMRDPESSRACIIAVHSLLSTFIRAAALEFAGESSSLAALWWPSHLGSKFMDLLGSKNPEAAVILAHYLVLIEKGAEIGVWYLHGFAPRVLRAIRKSLPPEYLGRLTWPDRQILNKG